MRVTCKHQNSGDYRSSSVTVTFECDSPEDYAYALAQVKRIRSEIWVTSPTSVVEVIDTRQGSLFEAFS